jgi:hypothetical protein
MKIQAQDTCVKSTEVIQKSMHFVVLTIRDEAANGPLLTWTGDLEGGCPMHTFDEAMELAKDEWESAHTDTLAEPAVVFYSSTYSHEWMVEVPK